MSNLVIDKWNKMYKLISRHKFIINGEVNADYKCGICKNILINAHQSICGCNFCYECINQNVANGAINCPNNTDECELESLSNIAPNHKMNKLISKLIVRCSNKMCSHQCQLIEMENHSNSCLIKSVKCPFNDVGCEHDDMTNDKLNDHMLSDIHNHNKILIGLIGNMRNEMRELKEKVEGNRLEIEMLKENDRVKNEIIESLKEEMKLIKQENEDFDMKMNARYCDMKQELDEKFDEEIKKMREENEKLDEEIKKMREENEKLDIERSNKIDKIDKYLNMRDDGRLELQIGKINEIKWMASECFYDKQNPYKMHLGLGNINNEFNIYLYIYSGAFDDDLKWPCQADITIDIRSLNDLYVFKSVTKSCKIEKPANNSSNWNDPIKISKSDWTESNLDNLNCLLICTIKFNN